MSDRPRGKCRQCSGRAGRLAGPAIALAAKASAYYPAIVRLGRVLYYDTRNATPDEAFQRARVALDEALAAYNARTGRLD